MPLFKFVDNKAALGQIVLAKTAAIYEHFAAEELQKYIEKMTGVQLPIEHGLEKRQGNSIVILDGGRPSNQKYLKKLPAEKLKDDGYLIATEGDNVFITSKEPFGVVFGTYQYLTKVFGVYFYDYAPKGEIIPELESLEHEDLNILKNPHLSYRGMQMVHCPERLDWMVKNGFNYNRLGNNFDLRFWDQKLNEIELEHQKRGVRISFGHHIFHMLLPKSDYMEDHPEYFQEINGEKKVVPQFYWSFENYEAALDEVCYNLESFLSRHPSIAMLDFWPSDGICDLKEDEYRKITGENFPTDESWKENVAGSSLEARLGDPRKEKIYAIYTKKVAERLAESFPKLEVSIAAYADLTQPCKTVRLPKNVTPFLAIYWRCYKHTLLDESCIYNKQYLQIIREWTEMYPDQKVSLSEYYMGMTAYVSLPYPIIHTLFAEWDGLLKLGIRGAKVHTGRDADNATVPYFINYLAFQSIVWKEFNSAKDFLEHYCQVFYQEAAEPIYELYMLWEKTLLESKDTQPSAHFFHWIFKDSTITATKEWIRKAESKVVSPIIGERVQKLKLLARYSEMVLDVSPNLEQYEALARKNEQDELLERKLIEKIKAISDFVKELQKGEYNIFGHIAPSKWFSSTELKVKPTFWERQLGKLQKAEWVKKDFNQDILQEAVKNKPKA